MHQIANQFRINVICAKTPPFPVVILSNLNYIHIHHEDVFLVGVMGGNGDVACMFEVCFCFFFFFFFCFVVLLFCCFVVLLFCCFVVLLFC